MHKLQLNFNNFKPTIDALSFYKQEVKRLQELSPSDARLRLTITQCKNDWKGEFQIFGASKRFYTESNEASELETTLRLFSDMRDQLQSWSQLKGLLREKAV